MDTLEIKRIYVSWGFCLHSRLESSLRYPKFQYGLDAVVQLDVFMCDFLDLRHEVLLSHWISIIKAFIHHQHRLIL